MLICFIFYLVILYVFFIFYFVKGFVIVIKYIIKGWKEVYELYKEKVFFVEIEKLLKYLEVVERVKYIKDELEVIYLIEEYRLVREYFLINYLKFKEVSKL